jgi:surface antigen
MRSIIVLTALAAFCAAPAAFAHPDHDDHGHGKGHAWGHDKHKEVFWDGDCKVERKWKHGAMEEKRTCRAPRERVVVVQPAPARTVVVYPPWIVRERNEYVYAPKYRPQAVTTGVVRCNSAAVGSVLGGVVGGVLGNQIGKGDGRALATIGGAGAGVLVGGEIGRRIDSGNQACVGEVLEVAPVNHRVQWVQGPSTYVVVPQQVVMRSGRHCRPYTLEVRGPNGVQRTRGTACRRGDGVWVAA